MENIVYILYSNKLDRFYIGYTTNLDVRLVFHEHSESIKFTSKAKDWEVFFTLKCETKAQALNIEKHIKRMKSKVYIANLVKYPEMSEKLLKKYR